MCSYMSNTYWGHLLMTVCPNNLADWMFSDKITKTLKKNDFVTSSLISVLFPSNSGVKMSSYWFYFDTFLDCPKQNVEVSLVNMDIFLRNKAQARRNLLMAGDSVGVGNEHLLEFTGVSIEYSAWLNNELYKTIASFHLLNASSRSLMNCAASMS